MGENGSGKGSLYKDLANSFGIMSILLNCSSEIKVDTLKRYLIGGA
jgi:adenylate kinase family enzyme